MNTIEKFSYNHSQRFETTTNDRRIRKGISQAVTKYVKVSSALCVATFESPEIIAALSNDFSFAF
jgi:hypothetical protein